MPKYTGQRINSKGYLGVPVEFEAEADTSKKGDTDNKAAYREAHDGIDPFSGIWVDVCEVME